MAEHHDDGEAKTLRLRSHLKFTGIPNQIIEDYTAKIGLDALGLYAVIKKFADYSTGDCYPKISTLASISGTSWRTILRKLEVLIENGLIVKESGKSAGEPNTYVLTLPKADLSYRCGSGDIPGMPTVTDPNKEELEPLNENQLTLSPPSSEGFKKEPKPRKQKQTNSDPRYEDFVAALSDGYKRRGWDFIFNGADGKQLKALLAYKRSMNVAEFRKCLRNYFESEGVIPGGMPHTYLMKLPNFWAGPLNQYGKLVENRVSGNSQEMVV